MRGSRNYVIRKYQEPTSIQFKLYFFLFVYYASTDTLQHNVIKFMLVS